MEEHPEIWLYCQGCEAVMQATDGYFEGDSHSCWNSGYHSGKTPKLLRLNMDRARKEIADLRSEVNELNIRIGNLLWYERDLRHGRSTQQKSVRSKVG